ncbi:anti-sigma factor family protein [Allokutzneria albata]|uniref:Putative zinc-finger n=1 Tax=Allokutzneria albata TaxID=211114 RepID=A0A1G9YSR0_ALLAB|nr:zf-HC2 domain-containing protein [Allokutzneria albata]SDN11531.1 Putative zinc-finger [Allokutzneria albata]
MGTDPAHEDVAAYALGALDDKANDAFERHLIRCAACQGEVADIVEVAAVLRRAGRLGLFETTKPRRVLSVLGGMAAGVVLLVIATLTGREPQLETGVPAVALGPDPSVQPLTGAALRSQPTLRVTTRGVGWGTEVDVEVEMTGTTGRCELLAYPRSEDPRVVLSWIAGSGQKPVRLKGSVALRPDEIAGFGVRASDGTLVATTG